MILDFRLSISFLMVMSFNWNISEFSLISAVGSFENSFRCVLGREIRSKERRLEHTICQFVLGYFYFAECFLKSSGQVVPKEMRLYFDVLHEMSDVTLVYQGRYESFVPVCICSESLALQEHSQIHLFDPSPHQSHTTTPTRTRQKALSIYFIRVGLLIGEYFTAFW
jgi:hypothetical protein